MNLIESLQEAAKCGYKSTVTDDGLGPQTWTIDDLLSHYRAQQSRMDEDAIAEDIGATEYIESEWVFDSEIGCIERLDYKGIKTGDEYTFQR